MPISFAKAQQEYVSSGMSEGEQEGAKVQLGITEKVLAQFGAEFLLILGRKANEKKVVATGDLLKNADFNIIDQHILQIIIPDYFDFPNEGVKGVKSSKNAPNSPYQFKTYTMNANDREGWKNIKKYIQEGRAKIATVVKTKDKALGIGRESKHLSLIDTQTNQLVYMIKKYGIKTTNYFNDAVKETFKDFEIIMSEAVGRDIIFTIEKLNKKK